VATGTPVDIKYSGFKSLTAFLKESAKEGLIKIEETKRGVIVTSEKQFRVVKGQFSGNRDTGVNGSRSSVRSHIPPVPLKGVGVGNVEERPRGLRVTLLRKPDPVTVPLFQRIGKE